VRLNEEKRREEPSPFEVILVAEKSGPVVAHGGMKVIPTTASTHALHWTFWWFLAAGEPAASLKTRSCWIGSGSAPPRWRP